MSKGRHQAAGAPAYLRGCAGVIAVLNPQPVHGCVLPAPHGADVEQLLPPVLGLPAWCPEGSGVFSFLVIWGLVGHIQFLRLPLMPCRAVALPSFCKQCHSVRSAGATGEGGVRAAPYLLLTQHHSFNNHLPQWGCSGLCNPHL